MSLEDSFNEHTKRSETERGSDVESQMSEVGKRLHLENRWGLLQEKRTDMKLSFLERNSRRVIRYKIH